MMAEVGELFIGVVVMVSEDDIVQLEYNIGYVAYNEAHGLSTYPCPEFWRIAANEGCTAIIGLDAHDNMDLETPMYYDRAVRELKELKIERIDELRMLI